MNTPAPRADEPQSADQSAIRSLHQQMLDGWNQRSGEAFAFAFMEDGEAIGFDGSHHLGRATIASELQQIFDHHVTPTYVAKVKRVRLLTPEVGVLRAVAGLVPPGKTDIEPQLNAVQVLVVVRREGRWQIASFQNTPAQFHGRPELAEAMTEELREELRKSRIRD